MCENAIRNSVTFRKAPRFTSLQPIGRCGENFETVALKCEIRNCKQVDSERLKQVWQNVLLSYFGELSKNHLIDASEEGEGAPACSWILIIEQAENEQSDVFHVPNAPLNLYLTVLKTEKSLLLSLQYSSAAIKDTHCRMLLNGFRDGLAVSSTGTLLGHRSSDIEYRPSANICEQLGEVARLNPNGIALIDASRPVLAKFNSITFSDLEIRSTQIAKTLISLGVIPDSRVAVDIERGIDWVLAAIAVLKAGACYIPVDRNLPQNRRKSIINATRPNHIVTSSINGPPVETSVSLIKLDELQGGLATAELPTLDPDATAYLMPTSGSAGHPKIVIVSNENLTNMVWSLTPRLQLHPGQKYLHSANFGFSSSIRQLFVPLVNGLTVRVAMENEVLDPISFLKLIRDECINVIDVTPSHLVNLTQSLSNLNTTQRWALTANSLKLVNVASEPLSSSVLSKWKELHSSPHDVLYMYGQTETTGIVSTSRLDQKFLANNEQVISVGRPTCLTQVHLLDDTLHPVPFGTIGELCVGGSSVAKGYLNDPNLSAEKFVIDPQDGVSRLYRTGDVARFLPDGSIVLLGRKDQQVKVRGHRVELGEVEFALNKLPLITSAAVVHREVESSEGQLIAFYTYSTNRAPDVAMLRNELFRALPEYMIPSRFLPLETMPLNTNGKLDRKALMILDINFESAGVPSCHRPQAPAEVALAKIWEQILDIKGVGNLDSFASLGGNSLSIIRMLGTVLKTFSVSVTLPEYWNGNSTLAELAKLIETKQTQNDSPLAVGRDLAETIKPGRPESIPASQLQSAIWANETLNVSQTSPYWVHIGLEIHGPLFAEEIGRAYLFLQERYEVLRTSFEFEEGCLYQRIRPTLSIPPVFSVEDNSKEEGRTNKDVVSSLLNSLPCYLIGQQELHSLRIHETSTHKQLLIFSCHHIITDRPSMNLFLVELADLYNTFTQGREPCLVPLAMDYADYSLSELNYVNSAEGENHIEYWKEKFRDVPETHDLPLVVPSSRGLNNGTDKSISLPFSESTAEKVKEISRNMGCSLHNAYLTLFVHCLLKTLNNSVFCVGIDVDLRHKFEINGGVGCYVNQLPVIIRRGEGLTIGTLLQDVSKEVIDIYEHASVPYAKIVQAVSRHRQASMTPLFQLKFVYQDEAYHDLEFGNVSSTYFLQPEGINSYDLSMFIRNVGDVPRISISIDFSRLDVVVEQQIRNAWGQTLIDVEEYCLELS